MKPITIRDFASLFIVSILAGGQRHKHNHHQGQEHNYKQEHHQSHRHNHGQN